MDVKERNREHILDEDRWTNWPILTVKNSKRSLSSSDSIGILLSSNPTVVHIGNMFTLKTGLIMEQIKEWPREEFEDIDALLDAGWEVD